MRASFNDCVEAIVCEGEDFTEGKASFILKNGQEWKDLGVKQQGPSQKTEVGLCWKLRFEEDIDKDETYAIL